VANLLESRLLWQTRREKAFFTLVQKGCILKWNYVENFRAKICNMTGHSISNRPDHKTFNSEIFSTLYQPEATSQYYKSQFPVREKRYFRANNFSINIFCKSISFRWNFSATSLREIIHLPLEFIMQGY